MLHSCHGLHHSCGYAPYCQFNAPFLSLAACIMAVLMPLYCQLLHSCHCLYHGYGYCQFSAPFFPLPVSQLCLCPFTAILVLHSLCPVECSLLCTFTASFLPACSQPQSAPLMPLLHCPAQQPKQLSTPDQILCTIQTSVSAKRTPADILILRKHRPEEEHVCRPRTRPFGRSAQPPPCSPQSLVAQNLAA